jgi:hypothetical protein
VTDITQTPARPDLFRHEPLRVVFSKKWAMSVTTQRQLPCFVVSRRRSIQWEDKKMGDWCLQIAAESALFARREVPPADPLLQR